MSSAALPADIAQGVTFAGDWRAAVAQYRASAPAVPASAALPAAPAGLTAPLAHANACAFAAEECCPSDSEPGPTFASLLPADATAPLEALAGPGADATALLERLRTGEVSVADATEAFLARAALAHAATGCLTSLLADSARARAAELDALRAAGGPVSVKRATLSTGGRPPVALGWRTATPP
ncbi:hypothetical protein FA09DRAFT_328673 [Tilletiopsis washingtonensis]|jgi:hypothetical protein|uniref:Amidase domain-containing protein n=1 Tax=Tilletiopsis washingtonensis TaxID=58919 RepID=A0A316ZC13_9BASI|nr:hypothetical protein FA09DRAFT_328673 [Tilletiopsis washingtonensis]PWN99240.1 hypothetical protein FA09DRAFT_328673 [Tilletiopsis washingtonensis]